MTDTSTNTTEAALPRVTGQFTIKPSRLERLTSRPMPEVLRLAALPAEDFDAFMLDRERSVARTLGEVIAVFAHLGLPQELIDDLLGRIDDRYRFSEIDARTSIAVEMPGLAAAE